MIRRRSVTAVLLTALASVGCPMKSAIWIVEGSTASHLEFGISDKRQGHTWIQWGGITVRDCYLRQGQNQHLYWGLERDPKSWGDAWPTRILYGAAPTGYHNLQGPESLAPGCYEASVVSTGYVAFVIDSAGGVRELRATKLGGPVDTTR